MDLELTVEKLNQVVIEQQDRIALLQHKLDRLAQLVSSDDQAVVNAEQEAPPPHY